MVASNVYNSNMTRTVTARFDGKVLVPTTPVELPIDQDLKLTISDSLPDNEKTPLQRLVEQLDQLPPATDLPADLSAQHDHYLYGTPKRQNP